MTRQPQPVWRSPISVLVVVATASAIWVLLASLIDLASSSPRESWRRQAVTGAFFGLLMIAADGVRYAINASRHRREHGE